MSKVCTFKKKKRRRNNILKHETLSIYYYYYWSDARSVFTISGNELELFCLFSSSSVSCINLLSLLCSSCCSSCLCSRSCSYSLSSSSISLTLRRPNSSSFIVISICQIDRAASLNLSMHARISSSPLPGLNKKGEREKMFFFSMLC